MTFLSIILSENPVPVESSTDFNIMLQWISVVVILLLVAVVSVCRIIRFRKSVKNDEMQCGCGCSGCHLAQKNEKLEGEVAKRLENCYICRDKRSKKENGR